MPIHRYFLSDFVTIQRQSFFELLEKGLIEEFSKRNPITNTKKELEFLFYPEHYILTSPEYTPQEAIIKNKSYTSKLFVPGQLTDLKSQKKILKWFYIGNLPLMTKRGHFILNGAARVIVNQILRSPGIYYQQKIYENYEEKWSQKPDDTYKRFYTDLICMRGTWLRIEIDKDKNIWAQMKKGPKIPIYWFLLAMGLSEKKIFKTITDSYRLLGNLSNQDSNNNQLLLSFPALLSKRNKSTLSFSLSHDHTGRKQNFDERNQEGKNKNKEKFDGFEKKPKSMQKNQPSLFLLDGQEKVGKQKKYAYLKNPPEAWQEIFKLLSSSSTFNLSTKTKSSLIARSSSFRDQREEVASTSFFSKENVDSSERKEELKDNLLTNSRKKQKNMELSFVTSSVTTTVNQKVKGTLQVTQKPLFSLEVGEKEMQIKKKEKKKENINEKKKEKNLAEEGRKWLYNKFMNPRSYNLGKQGRLAFNRKLGLNISTNQTTLTGLDVLYATDYLIKVEKGIFKIDDIDHLKNRRVRTSGELIQIQIGVGVVRLEKAIRENLNKFNFNTTTRDSNEGFFFSQKAPSFATTMQSAPFRGSSQSNLPAIEKVSFLRTEQNRSKIFKGRSSEARLLSPLSMSLPGQEKNNNLINFINSKAFNSAIREFFGTSPLSQFMDQINPLAELTHKRRLSSMGPGGVTRDTATLAIRGIHPTHYGRICPIETPEGKNTGLVNSMTTYARVNSNGIIESPFYKVYKGQVQKNTGMYYFSAEQEEKIKLAAADLATSSIGFLPKSYIPVRIAEDFTKIPRSQVQYVGISPLQMISIAASLIPFLEHDDANRALMGSNMQRQAVPLIKPERPIVGTGLEARAISDSGHAILAKFSGLVTYVSSQKIVIYRLVSI